MKIMKNITNTARQLPFRGLVGGLLVALLSSCSAEYLNPSAASETQVTNDVNGLITLANGLQFRYSVGRQAPVYTTIVGSGVSTRELRVLNAGNLDEENLRLGGAVVDGVNGIVRQLWSQSNLIKGNADLILNKLSIVTDPGVRSGLQAYATIYKALAIGTMATYFEQVTVENTAKPRFVPRVEALNQAIVLLETAQAAIAATPPTAGFTSRVVAGIDIPNTINALIARYALMAGDNAKALAAANRVVLTVRSEIRFDDVTRNPIWDVALGNVNVVQPVDLGLGLPVALRPVATDRRLDFYFLSRTATAGVFRGRGFFKSNGDAIPMYLPGEMLLIKAEAQARQNNLAAAVTELNAVLTKTTDAWGIGAGLPAYAGENTQPAILAEIYRQRRIELFMSGSSFEDARRFGRPVSTAADSERNRNFYPYPAVERDNNPNTPADPTI